MLEELVERLPVHKNGRQVLFLDELPWMDTPRSGFVTAFEGFWNTWGCHRRNLMVVVCGSATSWIQDNFIENHGGLYGRVTRVCGERREHQSDGKRIVFWRQGKIER